MGAELKYVHDPALIPHPPLVEQIASEIDDRSNHAMSNRAKFMVTGQDGKAGANAVRAVVVEIRAECEPAQIHHLFMVAGSVQEGTRRLAFATDGRVQSTATGLTGNNGAGVHDHVEEEHRSVCVLAPIPHVPMVDHGVLGANRKDNPAMKINCALLMVVGPSGVTGDDAQFPVDLE